MSAPQVITFGCRLNAFESALIEREAAGAGLADTVVVNTCAVTAEAARQARQAIRKARRDNPQARIIVTGCAAQAEPDMFARMPEVDHVIGNAEKLEAKTYGDFGAGLAERVRVNDILSVKETANHLLTGFGERARAFVQVQNGCDHRCTFCIIPFGRGNSRSVPMGDVIRQVQTLAAGGYREIVLSGVDITSYGNDLPGKPTLGALVRKILDHAPDLPRLRLSSVDSIEIDDALLDVICNEPRLMPHLHLSLQSGDDVILKRMKRRHSRDDAVRFVETVKRARGEVLFGADLIAGFPTETDEMFDNTLKLVEDCDLTFLHVFPYSERKGTPAARMPQVEKAIRKERAARLRAVGEEKLQSALAQTIGQTLSVLVEKVEAGRAIGHSGEFLPVSIDGAVDAGQIVSVIALDVAEQRVRAGLA